MLRTIIAQKSPSAGVLIKLYVVPLATSATISSIFIANRSNSAATFRVAITEDNDPVQPRHYIYYDVRIAGNDTHTARFDFPVTPETTIHCMSSSGNLSFNLFGLL